MVVYFCRVFAAARGLCIVVDSHIRINTLRSRMHHALSRLLGLCDCARISVAVESHGMETRHGAAMQEPEATKERELFVAEQQSVSHEQLVRVRDGQRADNKSALSNQAVVARQPQRMPRHQASPSAACL